jgi:hypothetical protein
MEFAPQKNLFKHLPPWERVSALENGFQPLIEYCLEPVMLALT